MPSPHGEARQHVADLRELLALMPLRQPAGLEPRSLGDVFAVVLAAMDRAIDNHEMLTERARELRAIFEEPGA